VGTSLFKGVDNTISGAHYLHVEENAPRCPR